MSGTIRLRVTQEHIEEGYRGGWQDCPVALALVSRFGGAFHVGARIARGLYGSPRWFDLSPRAVRFIAAFDRGEPVAPATFVLSDLIGSPPTPPR